MLDTMQLKREQLSTASTATFEHTVAELRAGCDAAGCARLCRRLNTVLEREAEALQAAGAEIACAAGCTYCCHLRVSVFPHEARALLHHLRVRSTIEDAAVTEQLIRDNARRIDGMTAAEHRSAGLACAFLRNGLCTAHEVRPSACAAYHSLSRERCEHSFRHPQTIGTAENARPALLKLQAFGAAQIEATNAARVAAGHGGGQLELHQALRALLDDDAAA